MNIKLPDMVAGESVQISVTYNTRTEQSTVTEIVHQESTTQRTTAQEATDTHGVVDSKGKSGSESHTTSKGHEQTGE